MMDRRAEPETTLYRVDPQSPDDAPYDLPEGRPPADQSPSHRRLLWTCRAIALVLGLLQAWAFRYEATPDGVSYLDVADAYREGRWPDAPNGYWSPLYSWLLVTVGAVVRWPPGYDFVMMHVANLIAYIAALLAFEYLMRGIETLAGHPGDPSKEQQRDWWILGYGLFLWATLGLIGLGVTTPDMLLAASAFAVGGILTRVALAGRHSRRGVMLGLAAGIGYLSKAAFLPVSAVAILVAGTLWWKHWRTIRPTLLAIVCAAVVAMPYAAALSKAKGKITFGAQAQLAYAWIVNGVHGQFHWQGGPPAAGAPTHPTRQIAANPDAFEFAEPLIGTYPPWYDPSYWYEGVKARLDVLTQLRIAFRYVPLLLELLAPLLLVAVATLGAVRRRAPWSWRPGWWLLVPASFAIAMYAALFLETRYIAPFLVMVWLGALLVLEPLMPNAWRRGLFLGAVVVLGVTTLPSLSPRIRALSPAYPNAHWDDARFVLTSGVQPGDQIAMIGDGVYAYWARLARVRIVAEVPGASTEQFWSTGAQQQTAILEGFSRAGASAVVGQGFARLPDSSGWRIGSNGRLAVLRLAP